MASPELNRPWNLESFLDALILELDKARETLAIKAVNRPLTYSVKDLALELQLFPSYDGEQVKFITAKPGEHGASKVSIQLGSITDRQIRESAPSPISKDDIAIDEVDGLDKDTRTSLRKMGVKSVKDIEKLEERKVDIEKAADSRLNYHKLAGIIEKSRRKRYQPMVHKVSLMQAKEEDLIYVEGNNLVLNPSFQPHALMDGEPLQIKQAGAGRIVLSLSKSSLTEQRLALELMLDAETVVRFNLISNKP